MLAVQYFSALRGSVFIWLSPDAFAVFSFVIVFLNLSYTRWIIINVQRVYGLCFVLDFINIQKFPKQYFNRFRISFPIDNTFSFSSIADLSDDWNLPASLFFFWGGRGIWVCISCLETACSTAFTCFSVHVLWSVLAPLFLYTFWYSIWRWSFLPFRFRDPFVSLYQVVLNISKRKHNEILMSNSSEFAIWSENLFWTFHWKISWF